MFTFSASQGICRAKLDNWSTKRCKKIHTQRDDIIRRTIFSFCSNDNHGMWQQEDHISKMETCDGTPLSYLDTPLSPCQWHLVTHLSHLFTHWSHPVTQDRLTNTNLWRHPHVTLGVGCVAAGAPRKQSKLVLTPCGRTFLHRKDGCLKMGFYLFRKILNWLSMGGCQMSVSKWGRTHQVTALGFCRRVALHNSLATWL